MITRHGPVEHGPRLSLRQFPCPFPNTVRKCVTAPSYKVWAARHGQGRAIAFTDSTIFSNFCTFQPGKAELMLGMVEWLNHGNPPLDPRPWLLLLGILPLAGGLWIARGHDGVWLVLSGRPPRAAG